MTAWLRFKKRKEKPPMSIRAIVLSMATICLSTVTLAQQNGTTEEQAACRPDVRRYCYKIKDPQDTNAFLQCLQANRVRLSSKCRAVLESHGV
jgi:hypothetical protein